MKEWWRERAALLAAMALIAMASGCSTAGDDGPATALEHSGISISDPWLRPTMAGGNTALYMVARNSSAEDDLLLGAVIAGAGMIEVHETVTEGDLARMVPRHDGVTVPAGGEIELRPLGLHMMVMDLDRELLEGDQVPVTLLFANAGDVPITAEVTSTK